MRKEDYTKFDYIIGMDEMNLRNIMRILRSDPENKVHLLLDYTDRPGAIADPWYTGNFEATYRDVCEGCEAFWKAWAFEYLQHPGILGIPIIPRSPPVLQRRQPGSLFKLPAEGRGIRKTTGIGDFRDIPS